MLRGQDVSDRSAGIWRVHKARPASPSPRAVAGISCLFSIFVIILALNASCAYGVVWYEEDTGINDNSCWLSGSVEEYGSEAERECDASGSLGFAANHMLNDTNNAKDYELVNSGDYCSYYGLGDNLTSAEESNWFSLHSETYNEKTGWWSETSMPPDDFQEGDGYNACANYRIAEWYDREGHRIGDLYPIENTWGLEFQNEVAGNTCNTGCGMQRYVSFTSQGLDDRPWASYFEEPKLAVNNEVEPRYVIPRSEHTTSWGYLCPVIEDATTDNIIELCFEEWRGTTNGPEWEKERVAHCASPSGLGHNLDRVITLFDPGTKFATYSGEETRVVSQTRMSFRGEVSRTNLENAVKADNEFCGRKPESSLNPANWALIGIASGVEGSEYHQITEIDYRLYAANAGKEFPISVAAENATEISGRAATITGKVDPYGYETSYIVEYGTTSEYGKNGSEGIVGSGMKEVPISARLSSLLPGTTYHYRIHAYRGYERGREPTYGPDQVFTTSPEAPTVASGAVSSITKMSATLNATVTPEGATVTTCKFEYGPTETYGKSISCSSPPGSGDNPVEVSAALTGLSESTTYHYRIVATNSVGTSYGSDKTFTTYPFAPTVVTESASAIAKTSVTLNAMVNPDEGNVTECKFQYGTTEGYGKVASCSSLPGSGKTSVAVSTSLSGLSESATYHFRIVATNSIGTSYGSDKTFETYPYAPSVVTGAASSITKIAATLNAKVNPNDALVTACTFEYGTTISYGKSASCATLPGSGTSEVAVSAALSGLSAQTLYHFRIVATNAVGTSYGADGAFRTWECPVHIAGSGESAQSVAQTSVWAPISEGCVSYSAKGSGLEAFGMGTKTLAAKTAFIGTDDPPSGSFSEGQLKEMEEAAKGKSGEAQDVVIPVAETSIAIIVNPPADCVLHSNHITNADLQKVWNGEITRWSEISTKEEEVSYSCARPIVRVVRKDAAGVTYQFKHYLYEINKSALTCMPGTTWTALQAQPTHNLEWPESCSEHTLSQVVHAANSGGGSETEEVRAKEGSIGYAALPDARAKYNGESGNHYHWLKVENEYTGTFNYPGTSSEEPSGMAEEANCQKTNYPNKPTTPAPDANWSEVYGGHPGGGPVRNTYYPICTLTWDVGLEKYTQAGLTSEEGASARAYLKYLVSKEGQEVLKNHDYGQVEEVVGTYSSRAAELVSSR